MSGFPRKEKEKLISIRSWNGTYILFIVAPLILGYVTDKLGDAAAIPGLSCTIAIAGGAICLGSIALLLLLVVASSEDINITSATR